MKHLIAALLIGFGSAIAMLGQQVLNWGTERWPQLSPIIEHIGSWVVGLVVVVAALFPLLMLYDVFRKPDRRERS